MLAREKQVEPVERWNQWDLFYKIQRVTRFHHGSTVCSSGGTRAASNIECHQTFLCGGTLVELKKPNEIMRLVIRFHRSTGSTRFLLM
jgi:hypothetical protein